jgi:moderate conductance mechanosensitive channel
MDLEQLLAGATLGGILSTAAVAALLWLGYLLARRGGLRLVERMAARGPEERARAISLWAMLRRVVSVSLLVTFVLSVVSIWGLPLAPFLAVGSAIAVAVGFGAQTLVQDVIAGFFILAEDQYRIGHVVSIMDVTGTVEDIRPRITVLRDVDGNVHYVPNGKIEVASNFTQEYAQVVLDIGIAYRESVDRAIEVIGDELRVMASDPEWAPFVVEDPQILGVDALLESSVIVRGVVKVAPTERWRVRREALRRLKNRLDAEGIEIPYPHLTLYYGDPPAP